MMAAAMMSGIQNHFDSAPDTRWITCRVLEAQNDLAAKKGEPAA
jgi:hypothetical protein